MKKDISIALLEKYLKGDCTQEEVAAVKKWYNSFEQDDDLISTLSPAQLESKENLLFNNILADIQKSSLGLKQEAAVKPIYTRLKWQYNYVAAIAAIFLIVFGVTFLKSSFSPPVINTEDKQESVVINHTKTLYLQVLPDSSRVWLSPRAQIKFPKIFSRNERRISMTGECFFDVTKDAGRPFIIHSEHIITKVWGTSFRIRDYKDVADVSVVSGRVSVGLKKNDLVPAARFKREEIMLLPNQKVTYLHQKDMLKAGMETDTRSLEIWKKIDLSFNNSSLKDIVSVLNEKFRVNIEIKDEELKDYLLTADMTDFNLPEILEVLKKSLGTSYQINGKNIILLKNQTN